MSNESDLGRVRPVVHPVAGRGQGTTEQRSLEELAAMNNPLAPQNIQIVINEVPQSVPDHLLPCRHSGSWMYLSHGGYECARCGVRRSGF